MNRLVPPHRDAERAALRALGLGFAVSALVLCAYAGGRSGASAPRRTQGAGQRLATTLANIRAKAKTGRAAKAGPSANVGQTIALVGSGFDGNVSVQFTAFANSTFSIAPLSVSNKKVTVAVPSEVVTGNVRLVDPETGSSDPRVLQVVPTISTLTPDAAAPGARLLIDGAGFTVSSKVMFKGVATPVVPTVASPTRLDLIVPAGARSGKLVVMTEGGTSKPAKFTVVGSTASAEPVRPAPRAVARRRSRR